MKFGKLIPITFNRGKNGIKSTWACLCDCGKMKNIRSVDLLWGETKSCGCSRRDKQFDTIVKRLYCAHLNNARKRGIENSLSKEDYLCIGSKECHYCGGIDIKKNNQTGATIELNGIDRQNNELFYGLNNSISCCRDCNMMKKDLFYNKFVSKIQKISKHLLNSTKV